MRDLNEYTGFCVACSHGTCTSCGKVFIPDSPSRKICIDCRNEAWYAKYADQLESLLLLGFSLEHSRKLVMRDNAVRCLSCGEVIKGGRQDQSLFCTNHKECRRARRRYRWLRDTRYVGQDVFALVHIRVELQMGLR